jgi:hypothetical protein
VNAYHCADCHEQTPNRYRLCDRCRKARAVASAAAQGLPPTIESAYVLDRIIDIIDMADADLAVAS